MKKIGILYICTGEYSKFWTEFYRSAEKYMLSNEELHYFIFTDDEVLLNIQDSNIHPIFQTNLVWPYPTLYRFKFFIEQQERLGKMDYLIFCNANLLFLKNINLDDLLIEKPMFATIHPSEYKKTKRKFPYERNKKSLAFVDQDGSELEYVCGGFNGGRSAYFLNMARDLSYNIEQDLNNGIIAIWHDESHFNRYFNLNNNIFSILPSTFAWPKNKSTALHVFISILDKHNHINLNHKGLAYVFKSYILSLLYKLRVRGSK